MNLTQPLAKKGKRLNETLIQRMNELYEPDKSMKLEIKEDFGRIKVLSDDLIPIELLAGETIVSEFEIKNVGLGNVLRLACLISHDTFFRIGDPTTEQENFVYSTSPKDDLNLCNAIRLPNSISEDPPMPICDQLKPSESIKVPLICRGEMVGHHKTLWLFVFKIVGSEEFIGFRYVQRLNVLPSLNLKPIIRPSMIKEGFYVLTLEVNLLNCFHLAHFVYLLFDIQR
ncbi:uncharacterized protein MELLADRAFT_104217 [Melampsora larici-populina 98AG31]|uniref:Uncharacterized protein n=1 Tax=Melampsora larici-populina (strain 98AG31 / pathotype 3-4-7) TaxID=747676 RepID=F4RDZ4_MELLP|nr:uncharacterized protein MELLADRAFT_104217 [Melampsora larici-populina 98AG31]EGG09491.1 hypothetical protein MELLADRAFT_104217 [Melampsora larici-populina 98AG31]